jgi:hypothetical protein
MKHVSFSNVVALLALFVALGGSAWALATDSVKSKHIVDDTVKSADINDDQVKSLDLGTGQVRSIDLLDDDVRSADVENESVTGEDIADGTLGTAESGILPQARISATAIQTFSDNSIENVVMDRIDYSLGVGQNFRAGDSELVIDTPGLYLVVAEIIWQDAAAGHREIMLSRNSTATFFAESAIAPTPPPQATKQRSVTVEPFDAGDTVELRALQTSGADLGSGQANGRTASLSVYWLGPSSPNAQ